MIRHLPTIATVFVSLSLFVALLNHTYTPALRDEWAKSWPTDSQIERNGTTLVLFAHPHCPCLAKTLDELQELVDKTLRDHVRVIFVLPQGAGPEWYVGTNWKRATLAGFKTLLDSEGWEAKRFGASTSGELMVFDKSGTCIFSGGITAGRGHGGPSTGAASVKHILAGQPASPQTSPVYGCPLFDSVNVDAND